MRDLPVALSLPGRLRDEVAAFVESEAGWQVVGPGGPPPPALVVADAPVAGCDCVVIVDGRPDPAMVRAALQAGALDVIGWPEERGRLLEAPGRLGGQALGTGPPLVVVGGTRGGVGTSTVALALAGLVAWAGRAALVVGDDDLLELCGLGSWRGPGAADIALLGPDEAAPEVTALARPVRGVPRLAVLGGGATFDVTGWPAALVVVDAGTTLDPPPQLVCARPGPGLRRAAALDVPVVLVGEGALDNAGARRVLGRRPAGRLPSSARVARAGAAGRVPAALPGSWLAALRSLAGRVAPRLGPPPQPSTARAGKFPTGRDAGPTVATTAGGGEA